MVAVCFFWINLKEKAELQTTPEPRKTPSPPPSPKHPVILAPSEDPKGSEKASPNTKKRKDPEISEAVKGPQDDPSTGQLAVPEDADGAKQTQVQENQNDIQLTYRQTYEFLCPSPDPLCVYAFVMLILLCRIMIMKLNNVVVSSKTTLLTWFWLFSFLMTMTMTGQWRQWHRNPGGRSGCKRSGWGWGSGQCAGKTDTGLDWTDWFTNFTLIVDCHTCCRLPLGHSFQFCRGNWNESSKDELLASWMEYISYRINDNW